MEGLKELRERAQLTKKVNNSPEEIENQKKFKEFTEKVNIICKIYDLIKEIYSSGYIKEIKVVIKNISLASVSVMGANRDSMKISYNGIDYVKFKDTNFIGEVMSNRMKTLTIYGRVNLNEWMGNKSVQVFIDDYELIADEHKYDF